MRTNGYLGFLSGVLAASLAMVAFILFSGATPDSAIDKRMDTPSGWSVKDDRHLGLMADQLRSIEDQLSEARDERRALQRLAASLQAQMDEESIVVQQPQGADNRRQAEPAVSRPLPAGSDAEVGDAELGEWMSQALNTDHWDADLTSAALHQAESTVAQMVGLQLDGIQCGERFCLALLSSSDGGTPDVGRLFGYPPFLNEGFTIERPDDSVELYFMQPGQSLAALRDAAGR